MIYIFSLKIGFYEWGISEKEIFFTLKAKGIQGQHAFKANKVKQSLDKNSLNFSEK